MTLTSKLLSAKPVTEKLFESIKSRVQMFHKKARRFPKLAVVIVGTDPASVLYTTKKGEMAVHVGMEHETIRLPESATAIEVNREILKLNADTTVDGILIQRPLPKNIPTQFKEEDVVYWIHPSKDVDAFHPESVGRLSLGLPTFTPCTPAGVMELLRYYHIPVSGKLACVVGRSSIVGKPMANLLLQANATIIHVHSQTKDLEILVRQADLVVVAVGRPEFITSSHIKAGAVVVDVGINRTPAGKLVGDVHFDSVAKVASAITPVPGGVGPMTIAMLLQNTITAAENHG